jgi:hypothetical protein
LFDAQLLIATHETGHHRGYRSREPQITLTQAATDESTMSFQAGMELAVAAVLLPLVGLWMIAVHGGDDEIVILARNEVAPDASGGRIWRGAMLNTGDEYYVEVRIRFLDQDNNTVGETRARRHTRFAADTAARSSVTGGGRADAGVYAAWARRQEFQCRQTVRSVSALGVRLSAIPSSTEPYASPSPWATASTPF